MKKITFCLMIFLAAACSERNSNSFSKKTLEIFDEETLLKNLDSQVVKSIKNEIDKKGFDPNVIMNVDLIHRQGNEYNGLVGLDREEINNIPIKVTYDGTNMLWEIEGIYSYLLYSREKSNQKSITEEEEKEKNAIDSETNKFLQQIQN